MAEETWWAYVERHLAARGWYRSDLARRTGINESLIHRWGSGNITPTPRNVVLVARALDRPVIEAVIAAGHYSRADLQLPDPDLAAFSNEALRDEVYARMAAVRPGQEA